MAGGLGDNGVTSMTDWFSHFIEALWSVAAELSPWLLLGCVLAGLLHVVVPADFIRHHLGGNRFLNVVKAVLFGVPLPLCSCSVLPAGLALKKDGASDGAAVGFLISTPQTGVDSITVSAAVLGWPFAVLKVVAATVTGLAGGLLTNLLVPVPPHGGAPATAVPRPGAHGPRRPLQIVTEVLAYGFLEILGSIWKWLLFGLLVSALVTSLVPAQSLTGKVWAQGFPGMLALLAIGIPLYVCTTGSLPIAAALVRAGMSPGAALVFLMAGPATNAATIAALWRGLGRRVTLVYVGTIAVGSLLFGWLFDAVVQAVPAAGTACHAEAAGWVGHLSAAGLFGLCAYFGWRDIRARRAVCSAPSCQAAAGPAPERLEVPVRGLTCPNCARKLQGALAALAGVTAAAVSHEAGTATVAGRGLRREAVEKAIRNAGFEPG